MAEVIPTTEKNWEFNTNFRRLLTTTNQETAGWQMAYTVKNMLLGQVHHGYDGTITEITPGVTYQLQATNIGGYWYGAATFTDNIIGAYIEITGSTSPINDGVFEITSVPGDDLVQYSVTSSGVAEAYSGDFRVSSNDYWEEQLGQFTAGAGGKFPAWRCAGSGAGSTGRGSGMDARDRWFDSGDVQSSTSTVGNRSWFVFENSVTSAQFILEFRTNATAYEYWKTSITLAPEGGLSGGAANAVPSAAGKTILDVDRGEWLGSSAPADEVWWLNMWHSDDGEDTRLTGGSWDVTKFFFICDRAKGAVTDGVVPWNGNQNVMGWMPNSSLATQLTFINDSTNLHSVIDKDASNGGPFVANFYGTSQFIAAATVSEYSPGLNPARLDGESFYAMYPIGLATEVTGIKGRHGYLSDFWFVHPRIDIGPMRSGVTFPADGSRQFIKIGHFLFPWDGVSDMRIR